MMTTYADSAWKILGLAGNHLWQSTVVAAVAGLLILTVRQARAQVRYWIWLAASVKFLVPFSALVALGSQVSWRSAMARPTANLTLVMDVIGQPFGQQTLDVTSAPAPSSVGLMTMLPIVLLGIWLAGTAVLLARWLITWRRIAAIVGEGTPVEQGRVTETLRRLERASGVTRRITLVSSTTTLEPGVFGIMRPVLLWSQSLAERLDDQQVEAILAHEVSHLKRRDNLTAALHMVVEALFWFHPLVWWLSARLVAERERACDEAVLQLGSDPHVYASGILKMCEFYVESPLTCVSGVTGSDLKRRIEAIMRHPLGANLTAWRKMLLAAVGIVIIAAPVVVGALEAAPVQPLSQAAAVVTPTFEVASVKPNKSGASATTLGFQQASGRFRAVNEPIWRLIAEAYRAPYQLRRFEIVGIPRELDSERFDVEAVPPPNASPATRYEMLQRLLVERFHLTVHREKQEGPIYNLVRDRADGRLGEKLKTTTVDCAAIRAAGQALPGVPDGQRRPCVMYFGQGSLSASGMAIADLADMGIARSVERAVVDRTGLKGGFEWTLEWTPDAGGVAPRDGEVSIFTALREQLGLRLEPARGTVDVLIVDHMEPPTDNQTDAASPSPRDSTQSALAPRNQIASQSGTVAFAAASVKANTSGDARTIAPPLQAGGRYTATNIPLELLVAVAFQPIQRYEVVGIPDWARTARYDIEARADGNPPPATMWLMLQALLTERFGMIAHRETRPMPVYNLVAARRGEIGKQLRLHTDDAGCVDPRTAPPPAPRAIRPDEALPPPPCGAFSGAPALGRLAGQRVTLDTLGRALSGQLGRMVVDRVGLTGPFDFTLEWAPPQPVAPVDASGRGDLPPDTRTSIFTAIEEQLGLKLVPDTGPVNVVVVDRLQRPTAN